VPEVAPPVTRHQRLRHTLPGSLAAETHAARAINRQKGKAAAATGMGHRPKIKQVDDAITR